MYLRIHATFRTLFFFIIFWPIPVSSWKDSVPPFTLFSLIKLNGLAQYPSNLTEKFSVLLCQATMHTPNPLFLNNFTYGKVVFSIQQTDSSIQFISFQCISLQVYSLRLILVECGNISQTQCQKFK